MTNVKSKLSAVADKVSNSKICKAVEKVSTVVGTAAVTAGAAMMNSSALTITADSTKILETAEPFIEAGVPILLIVAGYKFGIRFLKGSTR